ncbi:MAG: DinB family protein [Planctomycetota bacterium]|jgi:uncharacterized damage-inducible protein DinB
MYSKEVLLDIHNRCHRSLGGYLDHCRVLLDEELDRELEGFGYPTVRLQLHHVIGAERYWVTVILGRMDASEEPADAASIDALESFRKSVTDATTEYLEGASDAELSSPRMMITWGGHEKELTPAHIILRTQVHLYHHMGQLAAMCRLLGHPIPAGLDYPLT